MNAPNLQIDCDILTQAGSWKDLPEISDIIEFSITYSHHHAQDKHTLIHSPDIPLEVSIVLTDDQHIRQLNKDYRGKDKATNVLSFPQDEPGLLGDIIIAEDTLIREAEEQSKPFYAHFIHMLVHGCLHLLGHDHINDKDAEIMEKCEIAILSKLGIKNPYENPEIRTIINQ